MKKSIFYIIKVLALVLFINAFGQKPTIELTFTAENKGQYVPLDSIIIENLTNGGDTTLYGTDTILSLEYNTGIFDNYSFNENSLSVSQNYPNPFRDKTTIDIYLPEMDKVKICIINLLGKEVVFYENTMKAGNHSFTFYPGKEKYYLLSALGSRVTKTIKMVNLNSTGETQCKIIYNGYDVNTKNYKSYKAGTDFLFSLGDLLRYTGYAKTVNEVKGSDIIVDIPQNNETYIFDITEGVPCPGIPTVTYEGQVYNTVLIGSQCWLKENLNVGTMINGSENMSDNGIIEKYCYDNDPAKCITYGGLYQWYEMMQYTYQLDLQGICPPGWRIPSDDDWSTLVDYLGGSSVGGGKMKEIGTTHWNSPNLGASNSSGFTALPGAMYNFPGFFDLGNASYFWSTEDVYSTNVWIRRIYFDSDDISRQDYRMYCGLSVRCLHGLYINQPPSQPSNLTPADSGQNQPINITLFWTCTDPDNDSFVVYCIISFH